MNAICKIHWSKSLCLQSGFSASRPILRMVPRCGRFWRPPSFGYWPVSLFGSAIIAAPPGMALSLIVLLYVAGRIGYELGGIAAAAVPVIAFLAIEACLFATRSLPPT
jgi:hypothetical protein